MDKCFELGMIQAFVDGELNSARTEEIVRHMSVCMDCSALVAEVESENEFVFESLGSELDYMVPTERLREKVFAAISEDEHVETAVVSGSAGSWFGGLQALLTGRLATAMGALVICFAVFGTLFVYSGSEFDGAIASVEVDDNAIGGVSSVEIPNDVYSEAVVEKDVVEVPVTRVSETNRVEPPRVRKAKAIRAVAKTPTSPRAVNAIAGPPASPIEAEPGYLKTIATLSNTVDRNKDYVLSPSERIDFERNLAVVNNAISKMRTAVKNDPKNSGAKEVLNASYKSKIDLLSSVANRDRSVVTTD